MVHKHEARCGITGKQKAAKKRAYFLETKQEIVNWLWQYYDKKFWTALLATFECRDWPAFANCIRREWIAWGGEAWEVDGLDNKGHCIDIAKKLQLEAC